MSQYKEGDSIKVRVKPTSSHYVHGMMSADFRNAETYTTTYTVDRLTHSSAGSGTLVQVTLPRGGTWWFDEDDVYFAKTIIVGGE